MWLWHITLMMDQGGRCRALCVCVLVRLRRDVRDNLAWMVTIVRTIKPHGSIRSVAEDVRKLKSYNGNSIEVCSLDAAAFLGPCFCAQNQKTSSSEKVPQTSGFSSLNFSARMRWISLRMAW